MESISLDACLKRIYDSPASITVVSGKWKTGKTDFALRLAWDELKMRFGLVRHVASNISTDKLEYIDNFDDFGLWLFQNQERKAFIFDEAIKSTPSRKAMSKTNIKWLEIVPELSKGRCHLIVVTQEVEFTEKLFLHPTFVRAQWYKVDKKTVDLIITGESEVIRFYDIPATSVKFDPYAIAVWKLQSEKLNENLFDRDILIALDYTKMPSHQVMEKHGLRYRSDLTNAVKRAIKKMYNVVRRVEDEGDSEVATNML